MTYISSAGDKAYTIDTGEYNAQREISIDGMRYNIDWRQIAPLAADVQGQSSVGGRYSLLIAGNHTRSSPAALTDLMRQGIVMRFWLQGNGSRLL